MKAESLNQDIKIYICNFFIGALPTDMNWAKALEEYKETACPSVACLGDNNRSDSDPSLSSVPAQWQMAEQGM